MNLKLSQNPNFWCSGPRPAPSWRPSRVRFLSETQCKLVHQGISLVRLVTSVAEKQDILGLNPDLPRSFHLNLFHYVYVPTNTTYQDDCICRGWVGRLYLPWLGFTQGCELNGINCNFSTGVEM
jgi:hypothetical protein